MKSKDEMFQELETLKRQGSALDQAVRKFLAHEAAMRVIAVHDLWGEFARAFSKIQEENSEPKL